MFTERKSTAEAIFPFYEIIKGAWCRESCSPSLRENWPNGNPATGQCFVTAVAVSRVFGGEVFELRTGENETHYYNVIHSEIVDLSSEQFDPPVTVDFYKSGVQTDLAAKMSDPIKTERYAVFMNKISKNSREILSVSL